jgi:hypothetical protein
MRADPILSTETGRLRWALSHLVMALVGTGILMLACGMGIGLAQAVERGDRKCRRDRSAGRGRPAAGRLGAGRPSLALYRLSGRAAAITGRKITSMSTRSFGGDSDDRPGRLAQAIMADRTDTQRIKPQISRVPTTSSSAPFDARDGSRSGAPDNSSNQSGPGRSG